MDNYLTTWIYTLLHCRHLGLVQFTEFEYALFNMCLTVFVNMYLDCINFNTPGNLFHSDTAWWTVVNEEN